MNIFQRIGAGFQRAGAATAKAFGQIFKRLQKPQTQSIKEAAQTPVRQSIIRKQAREIAEQEANERALWAIRNAMEHPDDATARIARDKAIMYLDKMRDLSGKGSLQDWNRQQAAERWIRDQYSSAEGQAEKKRNSLEQMNANLNINLTENTYETLKQLTESTSFKKTMEQAAQNYKLVYGAVADEVENGMDPRRIEQTLELFSRVGMDNFEAFSDIVNLDQENYTLFYESVETAIYDVNPDMIDVNQTFTDLLEEFGL